MFKGRAADPVSWPYLLVLSKHSHPLATPFKSPHPGNPTQGPVHVWPQQLAPLSFPAWRAPQELLGPLVSSCQSAHHGEESSFSSDMLYCAHEPPCENAACDAAGAGGAGFCSLRLSQVTLVQETLEEQVMEGAWVQAASCLPAPHHPCNPCFPVFTLGWTFCAMMTTSEVF